MNYTIRKLEAEFADFDSSGLIAEMVVGEGYEDEATGREILVAVDAWPSDTEFFDSAGYSWAAQQAEVKALGVQAFSVADVQHTWYMGLVLEKKEREKHA